MNTRRLTRRPWLLELFAAVNLAFLVVDIAVAHSFNRFAHWAEYIPLVFSAVGGGLLLMNLLRSDEPWSGGGRLLGFLVGWTGIAVGMAGLLWHLECAHCQVISLETLVYSAPLVAPLAFAGLGFLLLLNRMVDYESPAWGGWVLFLALGGFMGNFGLSLADHAQNGFFNPLEWFPVGVSAVGVGYLGAVLSGFTDDDFLQLGWWVLGLQAFTGVVGFVLHLLPLAGPSSAPFVDQVVYGPPVFAPLLFVNLAMLAALGLWDLQEKELGGPVAGAGKPEHEEDRTEAPTGA